MGKTPDYLARVMIAAGIASALLPSIVIAVAPHWTLLRKPAMAPAQQTWLVRVVALIPRQVVAARTHRL